MRYTPATDAELVEWEALLQANTDDSWDDDVVSTLFARIKAEQAPQATAREKAIRECAEAAHKATERDGYAYSSYVRHSVLKLLQTGEETK